MRLIDADGSDLKVSILLGWGTEGLPSTGTLRVHVSPLPHRSATPVQAVVAVFERDETAASSKDTKWYGLFGPWAVVPKMCLMIAGW